MRKKWICFFTVLLSLSLIYAGIAESGSGSFVLGSYANTGYGDIVDDTGYGDIVDDTGYGDIVDDTGYGDIVDDTGYGDIVDDTGYGDIIYDTGYGDIVDDTGYGDIIVDPAIHVYMYVRTSGGRLNVRAWPDTNATIVGRLQYGEQVLVTGFAENRTWAEILYNGSTEYVLARYLSNYWPGPAPTATPVPYYPTSQPIITPYYPVYTPVPATVSTINDLNVQFNSMVRQTAQATVSTHPARIGGFVSLYWAPDANASIIRYCYEGETFTVLAYNNAWVQVRDNTSGSTGFLMRTFAY